GFTLIEVLIVMALLAGLAALGVVAGVDSYQRYLFRADVATAASLLQKARSSSVNNINESSYGVSFAAVPAKFVLFRGITFASANHAYDFPVNKSSSATSSGFTEVVFAQLS